MKFFQIFLIGIIITNCTSIFICSFDQKSGEKICFGLSALCEIELIFLKSPTLLVDRRFLLENMEMKKRFVCMAIQYSFYNKNDPLPTCMDLENNKIVNKVMNHFQNSNSIILNSRNNLDHLNRMEKDLFQRFLNVGAKIIEIMKDLFAERGKENILYNFITFFFGLTRGTGNFNLCFKLPCLLGLKGDTEHLVYGINYHHQFKYLHFKDQQHKNEDIILRNDEKEIIYLNKKWEINDYKIIEFDSVEYIIKYLKKAYKKEEERQKKEQETIIQQEKEKKINEKLNKLYKDISSPTKAYIEGKSEKKVIPLIKKNPIKHIREDEYSMSKPMKISIINLKVQEKKKLSPLQPKNLHPIKPKDSLLKNRIFSLPKPRKTILQKLQKLNDEEH